MEIGILHLITAQVLERSILQGTLMGATWGKINLIWKVHKLLMIHELHKFMAITLVQYVD